MHRDVPQHAARFGKFDFLGMTGWVSPRTADIDRLAGSSAAGSVTAEVVRSDRLASFGEARLAPVVVDAAFADEALELR